MIITRIQSRESYPTPKRPHYIIKLSKGQVDFFLEGREMKDEEIGDVIIQLVNALNAAEHQIGLLIDVIKGAEVDKDYLEEYLDEFPEEEDYKSKYRIEDIKESLFHAMMKKDEKRISRLLNELNVVTEKLKANG